MEKKRLLYVTHEMSPFLELTELAKMARSIPQSIQEQGYEIRVLMPRFGCINERRNRLHEVIRLSGMNIVVGENDNPLIIKVASIQGAKMQVYFLENEDYFHRKQVFRDDDGKFFDDNDERMIFFCKGAIETVKKLGWIPDIIHCHGWLSSLIPAYLKTVYKNDPIFQKSKIIYGAYGEEFQESLGKTFTAKALMGNMKLTDLKQYSAADDTSLQTGAIHYADDIVISSENVESKVLEAMKKSGKDVLKFTSAEGDMEEMVDFYHKVSGELTVSF